MLLRKAAFIAIFALLTYACTFSLAPLIATTAPTPTSKPYVTDTRVPTPTRDKTATAAAEATEETAAMFELIGPDLEMAGYSTSSGHLAWAQDQSFELTVNQPNSFTYQQLDNPNPQFANFVLGVDVEWDSKTGWAGCELIFRSERDIVRGEHLVFYTYRISGLPAWDFMYVRFNQIQSYLTDSHLHTNAAINQSASSQNHYVLLADGATVTAYANGTRLGTGTAPMALTDGEFAFSAFQESGVTTCTFSNAWIWELPN